MNEWINAIELLKILHDTEITRENVYAVIDDLRSRRTSDLEEENKSLKCQLEVAIEAANENGRKFKEAQSNFRLYEQRGELMGLRFVIREILKSNIMPAEHEQEDEQWLSI